MTNKELQKKLDKNKWEESAREFCDLSGEMEYCAYCGARYCSSCGASQAEREEGCLCAKAYNKMRKSK